MRTLTVSTALIATLALIACDHRAPSEASRLDAPAHRAVERPPRTTHDGGFEVHEWGLVGKTIDRGATSVGAGVLRRTAFASESPVPAEITVTLAF